MKGKYCKKHFQAYGLCNLKETLVRSGVTAQEGVSKGGLASPSGADDHDPGVGKLGHKRPLTKRGGEQGQEWEAGSPHHDEGGCVTVPNLMLDSPSGVLIQPYLNLNAYHCLTTPDV